MSDRLPDATMHGMPATPDLTRRAIIEVASPQGALSKDPVVRRYRLARVPLYTRPDPALDRFAHLRRSYD
jgi:hypothetical protein